MGDKYDISIHQPTTRDREIYAVRDADSCMITVIDDVDEGTIWLSIPELDRLIQGLQKIREELVNWKGVV